MDGLTLLAQGREAEVYLRPDGKVIKLMRVAPGAQAIAERELSICQKLRKLGVSTPVAHTLETVDGRPGVVMDRLDGADLLGLLERSPQKVLVAARVLGEVHAAMHEPEAPSDLPTVAEALEDRIRTAPPLPADLREKALRILATRAFFRALTAAGRRVLSRRYLTTYRRLRPFAAADFARWRFVHGAARLNEGIPGEHPSIIEMLHRMAPSLP